METINITKETKEKFEKARMKLVGELLVPVSQDDFIKYLLDSWKKIK